MNLRLLRSSIVIATLALMPLFATAQSDDCAYAALQIGEAGRVLFTDGSPLNVRSEPARSGEIVGTLPEDSTFFVEDGPTCADGIPWWQIEAGELEGWIAEAVPTDTSWGEFLVEPLLRTQVEGQAAREAELAAAPLFDLAKAGEGARLLIRDGATYHVADLAGNSLLSADAPTRPTLIPDGMTWADEDSFTILRMGEVGVQVPPPTAPDGFEWYNNAVLSPNGTQIAWGFRETDVASVIVAEYAFVVSDLDGSNSAVVWMDVAPSDIQPMYVRGWSDDGETLFIGIDPGYGEQSPYRNLPARPPLPEAIWKLRLDGTLIPQPLRESYAFSNSLLSTDGLWSATYHAPAYGGAQAFIMLQQENTVVREIAVEEDVFPTLYAFSPDNASLLYAQATTQFLAPIDVVAGRTNDGTANVLLTVPQGLPFFAGWVSSTQAVFQVRREYDFTDYPTHPRDILYTIVLDVEDGTWQRLDLPDGWIVEAARANTQ